MMAFEFNIFMKNWRVAKILKWDGNVSRTGR